MDVSNPGLKIFFLNAAFQEYWDDRDMSVLNSLLKILEKKMDEVKFLI